MWAISKQKVAAFLDRITSSTHLDAERILKLYSYILFAIPLLFWALIEMRSLSAKISLQEMIMKQPVIAIGTIIAITDFILGYYLLLSRQQFLTNRPAYRLLMISQIIGQLLVGNLVCLILAILGIYQAKRIKASETTVGVKNTVVLVGAVVLLIGCFVLTLLIRF